MKIIFSTSDWFLTIWLVTHSFLVKSIDRGNPSRCIFFFEKSDELDDAVRNFWANGQIPVQDFIVSIKKTKALLYADSF